MSIIYQFAHFDDGATLAWLRGDELYGMKSYSHAFECLMYNTLHLGKIFCKNEKRRCFSCVLWHATLVIVGIVEGIN